MSMLGYGTPEGGGNNGGVLGFLGALAQGLGSFKQGHEDRKEHEQDRSAAKQKEDQQSQMNNQTMQMNQIKMQGEATQMQKGQIQAAQGKVNALLPAMFQNGKLQSDPQYVASIKQAYQTMGLPAPVKVGKNGTESVDVSSFKKPFESLDTKQQTSIMGLNPTQRKPILDQLVRAGYDVSPEMYKTSAVIDAREDRLRQALGERTRHDKATEGSMNARTTFLSQRTAAEDAGDYARVRDMDARTAIYTQQLSEMPAKLQMEQQKVQQGAQRLQDTMTRFQQGAHGQAGQLAAQARVASQLYDSTQATLQRAVASQTAAVANGADPEQIENAQTEIDGLRTQLGQYQGLMSQAQSALSSGLSGASAVSAASGTPTRVTQAPKQNTKSAGSRYQMGGKNAFNATDGKIWVENSPGNWTSTGKAY